MSLPDPSQRPSELLDALARRVRRLRESRRWTQAELARRSGLSVRFLARVESGEGNISVLRLQALARALGTTTDVLVRPSLPGGSRVVALVGLRGAGKSTVGPLLAQRLSVPFVEMDHQIMEASGLPLDHLFELHGERYYRRLERETLHRVLERGEPSVVAAAGGVVNEPATWQELCGAAAVVWLRARPQDHWNRVIAQGDRRPMADNPAAMEELRAMLRAREKSYREAWLTVDTSRRSPDEIAALIVERLEKGEEAGLIEYPPRSQVRSFIMAATLGPTVAGTWYPADRDALRGEIDSMLADPAPAAAPRGAADVGEVLALIAPHAGFGYSGRVAANAFLHVRDSRPARVVLLGPSHYAAFSGAALPAAAAYRTPLGEIPLDTPAIENLAQRPGWRIDDEPFRPEHSLEAEIPFLQRVLEPGWRLLPVLLGAGSARAELAAVAAALEPWCDSTSLVVVSSDFTHFGPRFRFTPFRTAVPERIEALDMGAVDRIVAGDEAAFGAYIDDTAATICGRAAIAVLLRMLPPGVQGKLTAYDTSGRMTGDWEHSVSYAAVVFSRPAP